MALASLARTAAYDADAVDPDVTVFADQSYATLPDLVVDAAPLDRASAGRAAPRRHDGRVQRFVVVRYTAAAAQNLRDRTKSLTESVGQVTLGTESATFATAVVFRLRPGYNVYSTFISNFYNYYYRMK